MAVAPEGLTSGGLFDVDLGERIRPDLNGFTSTSPTTTTTPAPGNGATPTTPVSPWDRLADALGSIQAPAIAIPQTEPQTVSYVERPASNLIPLLLLVLAAIGVYYWYSQRKKKKE